MRNRIFYLCPDVPEPAGGIKVIYQHVQMLCRNGFEAYVVHIQNGFRCGWFDNDVPILTVASLRPTSDDIIVVPAVWALKLSCFAPGIRKVIINQGAYLTFRGYPIDKGQFATPYYHPDVVAAMVVSEDNQRYLQYAFPRLSVHRVRNFINQDIFSFSSAKNRQIAFLTRKRYEDIEQVINILRYRNVLTSFALIPVDKKSECEVATIFKESLLYLNFCFEEGYCLPAAEAMSCGCVVIGNHGNAAKEILQPEFSYPIGQGDIIQFASSVEEAINQYHEEPEVLLKKAEKGAEFIREHYAYSIAEKELTDFWRELFAS